MDRKSSLEREQSPIRVLDPNTGEVLRTISKYRDRPTGESKPEEIPTAQIEALREIQQKNAKQNGNKLQNLINRFGETGSLTDTDIQKMLPEELDQKNRILNLLKQHDALNQKEYLRFGINPNQIQELENSLQKRQTDDTQMDQNMKEFQNEYGRSPTEEEYYQLFQDKINYDKDDGEEY